MAQSSVVRKEDFKDDHFSTGESFADLFENSAAGKVAEGSVVRVGQPKAESARQTIAAINPDVQVLPVVQRADAAWLAQQAARGVPLRELRRDPMFARASQSVIPFLWGRGDYIGATDLYARRVEAGYKSGLAAAVRDVRDQLCIVILRLQRGHHLLAQVVGQRFAIPVGHGDIGVALTSEGPA